MRTLRRTGTVAVVLLLASGVALSPAWAAATRATLSGTVRCDGNWTEYSTTRRMTEPYRTEMNATALTQATTWVGIRVTATGKTHNTSWEYHGYKVIQQNNNYVTSTRFTMRAKMTKGLICLQNSWSGSLYY